MPSVLLFAYGSLKRGFRHENELRRARFIGPSSTAPGFRLVRYGEYPALVRQADARPPVLGELYELPLDELPLLDEFEECPTLYLREEIELSDGMRAFAYLIRPEQAAGLEEIPGGLWSAELEASSLEAPSLEAQRAEIGL